ncbi:MAG: hypothetical protein JOZ18_08475 [Chloroflexi bacterium]|nr:hypothetical protein [Chloroflexota bacterium]
MPGITKIRLQPIVQKNRQPPVTPDQQKHKRTRPLTIILSILALLALIHFIAVTHTAYPTLPITNCLELIRNTDYTKFVQLQPETQELGAVQLVDELIDGQPAALVPVTDSSSQHRLDVYIYGCSIQKQRPTLTLLFKHQGLIQGTVDVTGANTLSIGELDTTLPQDASAQLQPLQQSVYREYIWHNGTFVQTVFPGLYPVISRSEAEALQNQANNGQALPWTDPLVTAQQMAQDILHWSSSDLQVTMQDNDGTTAHVLLAELHPRTEVTATLARLVQHTNTGLWFVTSAQTRSITLEQTALHIPIASPMTIQGTIAQTNGHITAQLFDHTLTPIPILNKAPLSVSENGTYTGTLLYTNNIPDQPGLLLIKSIPPDGSLASGQLLLTNVLLG